MPDPTVVVDGVPVVPEPLRATDGGFTEDSVRRRLPCIVESILEHNNTYSSELVHALRQLAADIAAGKELRDRPGETWLSAPWFFVENYFYDRVLELTDAETGGTDPFTRQKASG